MFFFFRFFKCISTNWILFPVLKLKLNLFIIIIIIIII